MEKLDVSKIIFWVLLTGVSLILALTIALTLSPVNDASNEFEITAEEQEKIVKAQYYRDIKILLDEYAVEVGPIEELETDDDYAEITLAAKSRALDLRAPEDAKAMHLDIVVALNYLAGGFAGDEESLENGKEILGRIIEENFTNVE